MTPSTRPCCRDMPFRCVLTACTHKTTACVCLYSADAPGLCVCCSTLFNTPCLPQSLACPTLPTLHLQQSATGIICNITSREVGLGEVHHIGEIISPMAGPGCSIKYGAVNDPSYAEDELQVTLM